MYAILLMVIAFSVVAAITLFKLIAEYSVKISAYAIDFALVFGLSAYYIHQLVISKMVTGWMVYVLDIGVGILATLAYGILIVVICDFAFFAPVAITVIPCVRCISVYAKKMRRKDLRCISLWSSFNSGGDIHLSNAKPGSARNTNRASNHKPLVEVTVMAGSQHTQTHPEFTWRFLSTSERNPTAKPLVIYVNASSEQEARDTMPGVTLIFAARLPFHAFQVMEAAV